VPPAPVAAPPQPVAVAPPPVAAPISPAAPVAAPPRPAVAPRLVVEDGGKELPLPTDKAEIIVGREDPISGIFPEIDLTPYGGESGGVSRQHARINRANGQWTITDLNSTNYTRVDGNKIDPSLPVPIRDGARIQFGRIAVTFRE
jgi:pSer/pThr/pTyr-binding forkhead associated (FHA) protein